jgi:hypothetical protein
MEYRIKRSKIDFVELKSFVESVVVKQCRWDVKKVTGAVMHVREPPRSEGHKFSLYYYDSSRPHRNNRLRTSKYYSRRSVHAMLQ